MFLIFSTGKQNKFFFLKVFWVIALWQMTNQWEKKNKRSLLSGVPHWRFQEKWISSKEVIEFKLKNHSLRQVSGWLIIGYVERQRAEKSAGILILLWECKRVHPQVFPVAHSGVVSFCHADNIREVSLLWLSVLHVLVYSHLLPLPIDKRKREMVKIHVDGLERGRHRKIKSWRRKREK